MDKFRIIGGTPLSGELPVSGSKNSALPALAACLLTDEPVTLGRIPQVNDIGTMQSLLEYAGARLERRAGAVSVTRKTFGRAEAPYDVVKTMRASSLVLGPLVARYRKRARLYARRMRDAGAAHQSARGGARATRGHHRAIAWLCRGARAGGTAWRGRAVSTVSR